MVTNVGMTGLSQRGFLSEEAFLLPGPTGDAPLTNSVERILQSATVSSQQASSGRDRGASQPRPAWLRNLQHISRGAEMTPVPSSTESR